MYDASRWQRYSVHRGHVHDAINVARSEADRSIALVGAGGCYDADLRGLAAQFERVALVDIDEAAVRLGVFGQGADAEVIAPFDVTRASLPGPFDGIVSQCLLSQLVVPLAGHEEHIAAVQSVRGAHLRFLLESVRVGGWAILVWDVVASDTTPDILNGAFTSRTVERMANRAIAAGNFFTGLAPGLVLKSIETDPWLKDRCAGYETHRPWIWNDEPGHARIVYALTLHRR
jgi:hypothetical protein